MAEETRPGDPTLTPSPQAITVTVPATAISGTGPGTIITAEGQPNIKVQVLQPLTIIAVRAMRVFLQTLLGVLTAGPVTGLIPAKDFNHLLVTGASVAVGATVICILQNAVELLGRYDQSHPTLTA
jgi:hypothetical protein